MTDTVSYNIMKETEYCVIINKCHSERGIQLVPQYLTQHTLILLQLSSTKLFSTCKRCFFHQYIYWYGIGKVRHMTCPEDTYGV